MQNTDTNIRIQNKYTHVCEPLTLHTSMSDNRSRKSFPASTSEIQRHNEYGQLIESLLHKLFYSC